jgi:hypothetical protein
MKEDLIFNRELMEKRFLRIQYINPNCEYADVCSACWRKCSFENKIECVDWHRWKQSDLTILFQEKIDKNKNYLLNFE